MNRPFFQVFVIFCFLFLMIGQVFSQPCPVFTSTDISSPDCFNGNTNCDLCVDDVLTLSAEGEYLPDGGCVDWYYDASPGFDPYNGGGTFIDCGSISSTFPQPCDQCPQIQAVLINACGQEESNELFIFSSGSGFNTDDLSVTFPSPGVGPDANIPPCSIQVPTVTVTGCPNVVYVGPGENVPPGVPVIFFTSANANYVYDASGACPGGTVYVMQNSCGRVTAAFRNSCGSCGTRTISIGLACGCSDQLTYDPALVATGGDGDYVTSLGSYGNNGCSLPPISVPPPPPFFSNVDPVDWTITSDLCNGGPYYIKGILNPAPDPACGTVITTTFEFDVLCPAAGITGDDDICEGETATLTATGGGTYLWSTGQSSDVIMVDPLTTTTYSVTVTQGNCEDVATFDVNVTPDAIPILGFLEICEIDAPYDLSLLTDPAYPFGDWTGPGVTNNTFDPAGLDGTYTITFTPFDPCAAPATTDVQVNTLQTPDVLDATVCQGDPPLDLADLEDPSFPGNWSGPGVGGNFFDPTGLSGTVFVDFFPFDDCVNSVTAAITINTPAEPQLVADTICAGGGTYDLSNLVDPFYPSGQWTGPNVNGNIFDPSGMSGVVVFVFESDLDCVDTASTFILVNTGTVSQLEPDTICQTSGVYDLNTLVIANPQPGVWSGPNVTGNNFNPAGNSGSFTISFTPTGGCATPVTTTLTVFAPISVNNLIRTCNPFTGKYIVTFDITGSDTSLIQTSGGALSGRQFTSDSIVSGMDYSFILSDGICNDLELTGMSPNCACPTSAGQMAYNGGIPLRLCIGDTLNLLSDSTFVLDSNDTLLYVIHTSSSDSLGDIVLMSGNPFFEFDSDTLFTDSIYYYSVVAGSWVDSLDLQDTCLSVAPGVPFLFQDIPTVSLARDTNICEGASLELLFSFTGTPAFEVEYSIDGIPQPNLTVPTDSLLLNVPTFMDRLYTITGFSDSICAGYILTDTVRVVVSQPNSNVVVDTIVNMNNNTYQLTFEVGNLNAAGFQITGNSGNLAGNLFTTDAVPCNTPVQVCVASNTCPEICQTIQVNCSTCLTQVGFMQTDTLHGCPGDTITGVHSGFVNDGNDTLQFVLHDNPGNVLGTIYSTAHSPSFPFQSGMQLDEVYFISAIAGDDMGNGVVNPNDTCFMVAAGTPVIWHSLPDASLGMDTLVCAGTLLEYDVLLAGDGPFDLTYSIRGNVLPTAMGITADTFTLSGTFNSDAEVIITEVRDAHCSNTFTDTLLIAVLPLLNIDSVEAVCDPATLTYQLSFVINGGDSSNYQVDGDSGNLTGNRFVSNPISSDSSYQFIVTDGTTCDTLFESGTFSCDCITDAGTLQALDSNGDPFGVCAADTISMVHNGDETLLPGDLLNYVIYLGDSTSIDSIITIQNSNQVFYDPSFQYDSIYWVTVIAGPENGGGLVDTSAACFDFGAGVPVIFLEQPGFTASVVDQNCAGDCITFDLNFSGQAGFNLDYSVVENGVSRADSLRNSPATNSLVYCPSSDIISYVIIFENIESQGCVTAIDTTFSFNLIQPSIGVLNGDLCAGDSINVEGIWFNSSLTADTLLLPGRDQNGCDSTLIVNFNIVQPVVVNIDTALCAGDFLNINGMRYDMLNPVGQEVIPTTGCDSIVNINLSFLPRDSMGIDSTLCASDFILVNGFRYDSQNPVGTEILLNQLGCDSIVNVDLSFFPEYTNTLLDTLCPGEVLMVGNEIFSETDPTGSVVFTSSTGCDSTVQVQLTYRSPASYAVSGNSNICAGDSVAVILNTTASTSSEITLSDGMGHDFVFSNVGDGDSMWISPTDSAGFFISNIVNAQLNCNPDISGIFTIDISHISLDVQVSDFGGFGVTCAGENDGFVFPNPVDGIPPFTVNWSDGSTLNNRNELPAGNYIFTVTDAAGCIITDSVSLQSPDTLLLMTAIEDPNCLDENSGSIFIDVITGGTMPYQVEMDGQSIDVSGGFPVNVPNLSQGSYLLNITDANGCEVRDAININAAQLPQVFAGNDTIVLAGTPFSLIGRTNINPASVVWEPARFLSCDTCLVTITTPGEEVTYTVTVFDAAGCSGSDEVTVSVFTEKNIYVPSGFSPNGDGINDVFTLYGDIDAVKMNTFMIFDRWGNLVFETNEVALGNPNLGWDGTYKGKPLDPDVFVYYAEVEFANGETEIFKGDIAIVK